MDEVTRLRPATCSCGGELCIDEERPERHQVVELPKVQPLVTEYQVFSGRCRTCGEWTAAELPPEASAGMLAPRAMAVVATLTGKFRLSKRGAAEILSDS